MKHMAMVYLNKSNVTLSEVTCEVGGEGREGKKGGLDDIIEQVWVTLGDLFKKLGGLYIEIFR